MNLLLLLSALLSAITGVSGAVRSPQVATEQVAAAGRHIAARVRAPAARPAIALPTLRAVVAAPAAVAIVVPMREAIYAGRRRE